MIRRRAIRVEQSESHPVFLFALQIDELLAVADVSRVVDAPLEQLVQYTRADIRNAVGRLTESLKTNGLPFPLPITVALSSRIRFRQSRGPSVDDGSGVAGTIDIPLVKEPTKRAVWIVDGQLAALALSHAGLGSLPVAISGFVSDDVTKIREQFERISHTPRLAPQMAEDLLPTALGSFSQRLTSKEVPIAVCDWLDESPKSPFRYLIKGASSTKGKRNATVAQAAITQMISESLSTPSGCLFPYRNIATGETDFEAICGILLCYWTAVRDVFPDAWDKPPTKSRLMHVTGIRAMGRLMDRIMPSMKLRDNNVHKKVEEELLKIAPVCRWTSGKWEELDLKWNEIKDVPRHIHLLSNFLIRKYFQVD